MTDKIRIVGEFGDNAVPTVQSFVATLTGVESASLLRDGAELLPRPEEGQEGNGEPAPQA